MPPPKIAHKQRLEGAGAAVGSEQDAVAAAKAGAVRAAGGRRPEIALLSDPDEVWDDEKLVSHSLDLMVNALPVIHDGLIDEHSIPSLIPLKRPRVREERKELLLKAKNEFIRILEEEGGWRRQPIEGKGDCMFLSLLAGHEVLDPINVTSKVRAEQVTPLRQSAANILCRTRRCDHRMDVETEKQVKAYYMGGADAVRIRHLRMCACVQACCARV